MIGLTRSQSVTVAVLLSIAYALSWTMYMLKDNPIGVGIDLSIFFLVAFVPMLSYALGDYVSPLLWLTGWTLILLNGSYQSGPPESSVGFLVFLPVYLILVFALTGIEFGIKSYLDAS